MLVLISLLSFLLPTQIALHFSSLSSSVYGFKIDYLTPTLYLTDIIVFLIILLGIKIGKINKKILVFSLLYLVFVLINVLVSTNYVASIYRWIKVSEFIVLGSVLLNTKKFDIFKHFIKPLSYSVYLSCVLGILQFLNKGSIGGIFYWLGERNFVFNAPNIAPYPYSTFSHPNSFAGFLLVFVIFLIQYRKKFDQKYFWSLLLLTVTNIFLANSLNVYLTIIVLLIIRLNKKSFFALLPFGIDQKITDFAGQRFITHRIELIEASWKMIKDHFWFGVGLNNFIPNLVRVSNTFINAWELQPVHNIFLLVFSETGVIGLIFFVFLIFSFSIPIISNLPLLSILITGLSDHYWITLQQNILLFVYVVVVSKKLKLKSTV